MNEPRLRRALRAEPRAPRALPRALGALLLALIPNALVAASCGGGGEKGASSIGGASAGGGPSKGSGDAAPAFGESACWTCVEHACANQIAACDGDVDCVGYLACLEACPTDGAGVDAECEKSCGGKVTGSGTSERDAITMCRVSGPGADECPTCPHADAGTLPPILTQQCPPDTADASACGACIAEGCCDSLADCAASAACTSLRACTATCPTNDEAKQATCLLGCTEMFPEGVAAYASLAMCQGYRCSYKIEACEMIPSNVDTCLFKTCLDPMLACFGDVPCYELYLCVTPCVYTSDLATCFSQCNTDHPGTVGGNARLETMITCWTGCGAF